jgi:hypothetical protein
MGTGFPRSDERSRENAESQQRMTFLQSREPRQLTTPAPSGMTPESLFVGAGAMALEVVVFRASRRPSNAELRQLHQERVGKRATPVVVIVLWGDGRASLCGLAGDDLRVVGDAHRAQIERICDAALHSPDRHAAIRFLSTALGQLDSPIPGLRNAGLFALHELEAGVPRRQDWQTSAGKARPLLAIRGRGLIEKLGFTIEQLPGPESILVANGTKVAIAVFLERTDDIEPASSQFGNISPISHALARADQENLDYVVIAAGATLRVYPVKPGVGTGRRGRTETYTELNLDLLSPTQAGYLWLLYSADALSSGGSFTDILGRSADYAADLGGRLRERVYEEVVPRLSAALVKARRLKEPASDELQQTYQMALLVLFRLLFLAYAEDKELLPLHQNASYRKHSLKEMARQLAEAFARGTAFEDQDFYWNEVTQLWKAVDKGNKAWSVPTYNGGLFGTDGAGAEAGLELVKLSVPDSDFAPALASLLLDETDEGHQGPIDFRSLGVREFGTIYEGLLESELSVAETDLAVDPKTKAYLPAKGKAAVVVGTGHVYLHNASGARKSSGAYYTKAFAVEHLLEYALEPALRDHLARLDAMSDPRDAAEQFFDFRVADIATGSGHFLVAAIDHIERQFSNYLARRPIPGVTDELERLRKMAMESLGPDWAGDPIEDTQLLRRQIARRCIFGVDLNPLAVELARLSIWIHTFVPGLPLSFLDGNLVVGNSLVGIATFEEASELLLERSGSLFALTAADRLKAAREPMERLGRLADATAAEVKEARKLYGQARDRIRSEEHLLTALTASRMDGSIGERVASEVSMGRFEQQGDVFSDALIRKAEEVLAGLKPLHFPIAFPQVFLGKRAGFDVILGNPPWEKVHVEEHEFWARHYPGFRGTSQAEREAQLPRMKRARPDLVEAFEAERRKIDAFREVLLTGPYPGMGSGHPDLYKAFCWRFWQLASREGGCIGVVLPRAVFAAKGSEEFRRALFQDTGATDLTTLVNNRGWVFEEVHPQTEIGLVAIRCGDATPPQQLTLRGPYATLASYTSKRVSAPARFPYEAVRQWTDSMALPVLPTDCSAEVFVRMRKSPRFDRAGGEAWFARPLQGDLNSTTGKPSMDFGAGPNKDRWPVYAGEAFDLWIPDTGAYYAVAAWKAVTEELQAKRMASFRRSQSPFAGFSSAVIRDPTTLPCRRARVAFRRVSRATDSRTVRASLLPPRVILVDTAPYLLWPKGDERDQAFVLGILCSLPLDWFARRFIDKHVDFHVFNSLPVPSAARDGTLRRRTVECAGRLAAQDERFAEWAQALSLVPRRLAEDEQADRIAELDATVAHLYGLSEVHLVHVFETFHDGWDYGNRLEATLKHYHQLKNLV